MKILSMRCLAAFIGIFFLTIGGIIYMLYRTQSLLVFHLADNLGLTTWITHLRHDAPILNVSGWVVYSLPGGLWAAAYILIIEAITHPWPQKKRMLWASSIPMCGIISELLQVIDFLPGTFDIIDVICYSVPLMLYIQLTSCLKQKNRCTQIISSHPSSNIE